MVHTGRHFLQIPGPTNVPDRVLRAMDRPVIDHRGPEFAKLAAELLESIKTVFQTEAPVLIYPGSASGAWEAAIVNTLSPGDRVLMYETGHFSELWRRVAERFAIKVECIPSNWRRGADAAAIESQLIADKDHKYKAVLVVHNETSTGVTSDVRAVRTAMDRCDHPALLMVDAVSSVGCIDYRHDEWGVDVTIAGSQKGLMLPPGLCMNALSTKALTAAVSARLPRSYWDWKEMMRANQLFSFPFTPATNLLHGLKEALLMLDEEGLPNVFARHERHARATRECVRAWGLELVCQNDRDCSSSVTAVLLPEGNDADGLRKIILEKFDMSLGAGLGKLARKAFRIGHIGSFNDLTLIGTLGGVEMGLKLAEISHYSNGVAAGIASLLRDVGKSKAVSNQLP